MAGIISVKLYGATPKIKYKFKPKAKLPKKAKASKSNSPQNIHKKDSVTGVSQKKKVTLAFANVAYDEAEPFEMTPKYHIEPKLFEEDFSFWQKLPSLVRYIILKTEFIQHHKGKLCPADSNQLIKTAARLERLLGAILNGSIPKHQVVMLEPFANLKLMTDLSINHISSQLKQLHLKSTTPLTQTEKWLNLTINNPNCKNLAQTYQSLIKLNDACAVKDNQQIVRNAMQVQVKGLLAIKLLFKEQWHKHFNKNLSRQSITFNIEVSQFLPLFNFSTSPHPWHMRFEAIISSFNSTNSKVLFRYSAGTEQQHTFPLQTRGERLLSGRHLKFFNNEEDAIDYLSTGLLLNLCQPFSEKHNVKFETFSSTTQTSICKQLLGNIKLQQHIIRQASTHYSESITASDLRSVSTKEASMSSSVNQSFHQDFSRYLNADRTKVPLLNQLLQEPLRLACRNPQYFSIKVPHKRFGMVQRKGDLGYQWIKNITKNVVQTITKIEQQTHPEQSDIDVLSLHRQKIKQAITALNAEFHAYLSVVKKYETSAASVYQKYRELKQQFENNRDAKCRAEYIRSVICTHALLTLAYNQSLSAKHLRLNKSELNFCRYLSKLVQDYEHPDCYIVKEEANCYLTMTSVLKDTQIEVWKQIDLKFELALAQLHQGVIVIRSINDDIDPNMNGNYIDILLIAQPTESSTHQNNQWLEHSLQQLIKLADIPLIQINLTDLPGIDETEVTANTHLSLQFKKGRDKFYDLQFIKLNNSTLAHHQTEYATGTSIDYWIKKYNGWINGHEAQVWLQFCESNRAALHHLFGQIIQPNSHVANEIESITNQFENQSTKRTLLRAILAWKRSPDLFEDAQSAFDDFLKVQYQHYQDNLLKRLSILKARLER